MKIYFGVIESDFNDKNSSNALWNSKDQLKGWGKRYKVRIPGVHSEDKFITPSNDLPIAEVIYPVTAGTGHDACYQTDALKPGSMVIILEDDNKRLFITGCKGNNEQTELFRGEPDSGFIPYSLSYNGPIFNFSAFDNAFIESSSNAAFLNSWSNYYQLNDGKRTSALSSTTTCDKAPLGQIQIIIRNFIRDVNEAKIWINKQKQATQNPGNNVDYFTKSIDNQQLFSTVVKPIQQIYSYENWLTNKIQNVSKDVSKFLKDIILRIETGAINLINDALKGVYYLIFPNEQQKIKEKVDRANDLISCLFKKIIRNLLKMAANFLKRAAELIINPVSCLIDNFIGGFFGKLIGLILNSIQDILQPLNSILGAFNLAEDILNVVEDVLTTLSCDESPSCPKIQEWSLWNGPESLFTETSNFTDIFNKIKSFASTVQEIDFNFDFDFTDIFKSDCNVNAVSCGPPKVAFLGGGGFGASGNAVVNSLGQIIGVDIVNSGTNYTSTPIVKFEDSCGNGSGAIARAIIGKVNLNIQQTDLGINQATSNVTSETSSTTTTGIINVIIEDPGTGYLSYPDGSLGGNGITITPSSENKNNNDKYFQQYYVNMKLCEIVIEDGGFNYKNTDKIIITPSNGALAKPFFTATGSLYKIEILNKGEGFDEMPEITIETKTGYNAILIPRLCVEKTLDTNIIYKKLINVIDCVGR
jgi:hypothetical protein